MLIPIALGAILVLLLGRGMRVRRGRRRFQLLPMWAVWDEDVLVVDRSLARTLPPQVLEPVGGVCALTRNAPRWRGPRPIGVRLPINDLPRSSVPAPS